MLGCCAPLESNIMLLGLTSTALSSRAPKPPSTLKVQAAISWEGFQHLHCPDAEVETLLQYPRRYGESSPFSKASRQFW